MALLTLPVHKAGLTIEHNEHLGSYQTVEEYLLTYDYAYQSLVWVSVAERENAVKTNEMWTLQWYPDTPIGSCIMRASTLMALIDWVKTCEDNIAFQVE